jgi:hypothetical protein
MLKARLTPQPSHAVRVSVSTLAAFRLLNIDLHGSATPRAQDT